MPNHNRRTFLESALAASGSLLLAGSNRLNDESLDLEIGSPEHKIWLGAEANALFAQNRISSSIGVFHVPSIQTYRSFFAWDSGWNVISLMHLDPEAALTELRTIFAQQTGDGRVPHEVRVPELKEIEPLRMYTIAMVRRQYDANGKSAFIDPPSFLVAAGLLYERTGDARVLELIPAMDRCARYLTEDRDLMGDGLVSIIHPWESGTDSAPVFDAPMGYQEKDPLLPAKALIGYPRLLNFSADLDWDLDRIAEANRFVFEDVGMNSITAAGLVSEDKARRLIEENLKSPDQFHGPWLVPFNSISELAVEKFAFEDLMLWRGHCIWMNMNWLTARAAAAYGERDLAREITLSSARMVADSGFYEFYDPRTGVGTGAPGYTWATLLLDMIESHLD